MHLPKSRHALYRTNLCTHSVEPMKRVSEQRACNILPLTQWVLRWRSARQPWPCWWCWAGGSREQCAAGRHPDPSLTGSLGTGDRTNVIVCIRWQINIQQARRKTRQFSPVNKASSDRGRPEYDLTSNVEGKFGCVNIVRFVVGCFSLIMKCMRLGLSSYGTFLKIKISVGFIMVRNPIMHVRMHKHTKTHHKQNPTHLICNAVGQLVQVGANFRDFLCCTDDIHGVLQGTTAPTNMNQKNPCE